MSAITFNVDDADKESFASLVRDLGLNISSALNLFIKSSIREKKLNVSLDLNVHTSNDFNETTIEAYKEVTSGAELETLDLDNFDEFIESL